MTAHVSPDAPRPPTRNQPRGVTMPFDEAAFTRTAAELVAQGDRVPAQREADSRPIEPGGTVIEVQGDDGQRQRFVSNGYVWIGCVPGETFQGFTAERVNRSWTWWVVAAPDSGDGGRMRA